MTPSSTTTGIDRKSLKRPDEFTTTVTSWFDQIASHSRLVIATLCIMVVVAFALTVYSNSRGSKESAARDALYLAREAQQSELSAISAAENPVTATPNAAIKGKDDKKAEPVPPKVSVNYKKLDVDAKFPQAVAKYKLVIQDYKGTRAEMEANLALGDLYLNHGQPDKALDWYKKATTGGASDFEKALILSSIGYAYENLGKYAEAVQSFDQAMAVKDSGLKGELLMAIARNHEANHDNQKARQIYDQVLAQFPNTDYARSAEIYRNRLK